MNGLGCRQKGKAAEREVAALIAEWWGAFEPGCKFASTPGSGGWSTAQMRAAFNVAGDLSTTAKCFPFTVEVKRREGWSMPYLLAGRPSPVWGWWEQATKAAAEEGRRPMLWVRKSREPWSVMLPEGVVDPAWGLSGVVWRRFPFAARGWAPRVKPFLVAWEALQGLSPVLFAGPEPGEKPALKFVAG